MSASHRVNPNLDLCIACRDGDTAAVVALIASEQGDANAIYDASKNITALMLAAEHGDVEMVHALLEYGSNWQERSLDGLTPGEFAMGNKRDRGVFKLLLEWAVQCEMLLGRESLKEREEEEARNRASNEEYLMSSIQYEGNNLIDDSTGDAVMMTWETPLMERHAKDICWKGEGEGNVLNIGFGMGIIDRLIQKEKPGRHVIIEAHPDVYKYMMSSGWDKIDHVTVVFGRWQDVIDSLGMKFDGIFFDTYGEFYEDMQLLHKRLPTLMNPGGVYSFFNGLSPDNIFFHLVAGEVARRELNELGFEVSYYPIRVEKQAWDETWDGISRKYWHFDQYFVPKCMFRPPS
jgi:protein arginine N-methyltransferase 2